MFLNIERLYLLKKKPYYLYLICIMIVIREFLLDSVIYLVVNLVLR